MYDNAVDKITHLYLLVLTVFFFSLLLVAIFYTLWDYELCNDIYPPYANLCHSFNTCVFPF